MLLHAESDLLQGNTAAGEATARRALALRDAEVRRVTNFMRAISKNYFSVDSACMPLQEDLCLDSSQNVLILHG